MPGHPLKFTAVVSNALSCKPAEVVFLDDDEPNVSAACELGMHGILFEENAKSIADIQSRFGISS